jgi:hypothetical protein
MMTLEARVGFVAKHVRDLLLKNPDLSDEELQNAVRLRVRAHMAKLGRASAEARAKRRNASRTPLPLDVPQPSPSGDLP